MARTIEYHNEFGVMLSIINTVRKVYQDIAVGNYTWINIWIDGKLVGSIDAKQNRLILNLLPKEESTTVLPVEPPLVTSTVSIPF